MIIYRSGGGFFSNISALLFRLHGSALYRGLVPAAISTAFYLAIFHLVEKRDFDTVAQRLLDHPYPIAALLGAFTFLLTFKASFSYNRYWEACTTVFQMHSKWLEVGTTAAAFHYQSDRYRSVKPPAFGTMERDSLKRDNQNMKRRRVRENAMTREQMKDHLDEVVEPTLWERLFQRRRRQRQNQHRQRRHVKTQSSNLSTHSNTKSINATRDSFANKPSSRSNEDLIPVPTRLTPTASDNTRTRRCRRRPLQPARDSFDSTTDILPPPEPSLFLQEAAHLLSLLSAVALSTLRNDVETAESPLTEFQHGMPWPPVDPDEAQASERQSWYRSSQKVFLALRYLVGLARTPKSRTLYNAARPLQVMGGVSDAEIQLLQCARGPKAKVGLVMMWLQEFISREYMNGSTGNVAPPIISRLYHLASDGFFGYNQARKVAYIPFPFPHNQLTSCLVVVIMIVIPFLTLSYVNDVYFGAFLNTLTILTLAGLQEVARELEDPFRSVPNDLPLNHFQAQFNEALLVMFAGYHPEAWWEVEGTSSPMGGILRSKSQMMGAVAVDPTSAKSLVEMSPPPPAPNRRKRMQHCEGRVDEEEEDEDEIEDEADKDNEDNDDSDDEITQERN